MLIGVLVIVVSAGCERTAPIAPNSIAPSELAGMSGDQHVNIELSPDMQQQLAALHPLFANSHDLDKAIDGWCVPHGTALAEVPAHAYKPSTIVIRTVRTHTVRAKLPSPKLDRSPDVPKDDGDD